MQNTNEFMDKRLLHLFHPVVADNIDEENVGFYVDQTRGIAFGGHRRSWGRGDLFVRYRGEIKPFDWSHDFGMYHYSDNTFSQLTKLPGRRLADGGRELISEEACNEIFDNAFQQVAGYHQLVINPAEVLEFIRKRTMISTVNERVINIQGFESVNLKGEFVAKLDHYDGMPAIMFRSPNGTMPLMIDERSSLIPVRNLSLGEWVVVRPVGIVQGVRLVKVLRLHDPGVRMTIQSMKSGILMPGDPRYSLHENEDNNSITELDIKTFSFIEGQDKGNLKTAPMLSIQLDTFVRGLKAVSGYRRVELLYKNSHTPYVLAPFVKEGEPVVEVVASSFSPYKSGKVVTL